MFNCQFLLKLNGKKMGKITKNIIRNWRNKGTERFKLELTGVGSLIKYSGKTNEYDSYYFVDHDGNKEKINQFNLQVLIKEKKVIIGNINNIENNAIIYIIPRLNKTKYIKITENNEKLINLLKQINKLNEQEKILYKQYFDEDKAILIDGDWETIKEIVPQNQKRKDKAHDQGTSEIIRSTKRVGKSVQTSQRKSKPTSSYQTSSYQLDERCTRLTNLITIYTYLYEQHQTHIQNIKNTTQGIQQQNLLETENANYLRGLNLRLNEMENILPGIRNSPLYNNLMTEFIQQQVNQQNIPQHQPTRTVPRHQRQSHPRRQGGQRQLTRFGREAFQEEALPHEENRNDPSSSRPDKGKNVVETHSEHSSDSEHTTQQLRDIYRQQQLGEGSSLPGHLQGGFMGTTPYSTDSLTDEQTIELLAADRFNLSQGGQGILRRRSTNT
ncbi:hypothetical protein Mgra_00005134 [Meloidogyne graminicola]|uniref:Uncharacterized protein n=1 Tax=Meloidogyne graminicola TaxID=189291 RepID=A0A8S9ZQM5_9BILA|nr:hypothetical protein Mgra_00005134 [Meloidogyne graminicola]